MFLPKLNIDRNTITEGTAYLKRNIWYDLTKTNLSKILESDSEWFIFDLITERFPIMEFIIDQQTGFATKSPEFVQNYLKWVSDKTFKHIRKVRDYFLDDLFEELDYENSIKNFCDKIIERFGQNKIILNEVYLSEYYLAKNNEIKMFNSDGAHKIIFAHNQPDIVNKFLRKLYSLFRKYLPSAYYISMPNYSYSDENHWFGLHPLHFNRNYYEYVSNCVRTIVSISNNKNSIALSLELLHKEQSDNNKCFIETNKCLSQAAKNKLIKWRSYADVFENLLKIENGNVGKCLAEYFIKNDIKKLAIYGNTEITKILLRLLKDNAVQISYVVENTPVEGVLTLPRSTQVFPEADLILIADIENYSTIFNKLCKLNVKIKIENAMLFFQGIN